MSARAVYSAVIHPHSFTNYGVTDGCPQDGTVRQERPAISGGPQGLRESHDQFFRSREVAAVVVTPPSTVGGVCGGESVARKSRFNLESHW